MHEIYSNLSKKDKKAFNKLSDEEKAEIIQATVVDKVSSILLKAVTNATIDSMLNTYEMLYQDFVKPLDESMSDHSYIDKLLSELRMKHLEYVKRQNKEGETE